MKKNPLCTYCSHLALYLLGREWQETYCLGTAGS